VTRTPAGIAWELATRRLLLVALLTTGVSLTTSTAEAAESCVDDGDCSGVLLCRESRCVPVHCQRDQQCPAGRMCREELCRLRQCYATQDCTVGRRCHQGLCVVPPPRAMHRVGHPGGGRELAGWRFLGGPTFPAGFLVHVDLPAGSNRWLEIGLGTSLIEGGIGWRIGVRSEPARGGTVSLDLWAAAMGYAGDASANGTDGELAASAGELITGSGRFLFGAGRSVNAVWATAGSGFTLRLTRMKDYLLRVEIGAALLYNDRYPADADFAVLPTLSLHGGWAL